MVEFVKSVFENIRTISFGDPLYDFLPRLVDGTTDTIYTIQRTPGRTSPTYQNGRKINVEITPPALRVFLVFDINNQLYSDCIERGKCKIHIYDTLVVINMDENYHADAMVEFYMDLMNPLGKYIVTDESLSPSRGSYFSELRKDYSLVSYRYLHDTNQTSPMIDKVLTDQSLLGGKVTKEVTFYDAAARMKRTVLQDVVEDGLLSKLDDRFIHYSK